MSHVQKSCASLRRYLFAGGSGMALALCLGVGGVAAQDAGDPDAEVDEIIVTGYRGSLAAALDVKRNEAGIVDVIMAEDIADFPDTNLAEAIQRIPGVSIDRDPFGALLPVAQSGSAACRDRG